MVNPLSTLFRDVRYSLRSLRKTPAFTLGAVATVALTVGTTTAIFSVVHGVLLRQLPYRNVEQVFWIWSDQPGRDRTPFNVPDFIDYAVVTYSVSQRAREVGIRVALGASRSNIVRLVMGHGIRCVLIGLVLGIAMAFGVTRLLSTMLFGVAATDVVTFGQVAVVVGAVSVLTCAVPIARVGRVAVSVLKGE